MNNFKLIIKHIGRVYHNPVIKKYLDSLPEHDAFIAAETLTFIKQEYPEVRLILNGNLVSETIEED